MPVRRELGPLARGHDRRRRVRGLRRRRHRRSAASDRGRVRGRGVSARRHRRDRRGAEAVRQADQPGLRLLPDRHRRVPLRRLRDRRGHVRHRARGRLRQTERPRRVGSVGHLRQGARTARYARGLVLAVRRALFRDVRRRPRGSRQDRGQEPPQRHARAEVDAQARDHGEGRARGAHHLVAVRTLRLRRAVRRRRRVRAHARRSREELPRRPGLREGGIDRGRRASAARPELRLPGLEADDLCREGRLRPGGDQRAVPRSST